LTRLAIYHLGSDPTSKVHPRSRAQNAHTSNDSAPEEWWYIDIIEEAGQKIFLKEMLTVLKACKWAGEVQAGIRREEEVDPELAYQAESYWRRGLGARGGRRYDAYGD
jgi:hypothetical protein